MEFKLAGNAEFRAKNWAKAGDLYTKALEIDNNLPEVYANRAACALNLHDYHSAVNDCQRGKQFRAIASPLRVKLCWREAVALRMLGSSRAAWEKTVKEGLELDPGNGTLQHEAQYVFVESEIPAEFTTNSQKLVGTSPAAPKLAPTAQPDFLPALPLNYSGILQLLRNKSDQAYDFWYAKITPEQLQQALATVGVEPDVLDYIFAMILARPTETETNRGYLLALQTSPRYETAFFMANDDLKAQVMAIASG